MANPVNNNTTFLEVVAKVDHLFDANDIDWNRPGATVALCSVVIGGHFLCTDIRIVRARNGEVSIVVPHCEVNGKKIEYFRAVTEEGRQAFRKAVMKAFAAAVEKRTRA